MLYMLILYGFNQQIRFNSSYDYNNPVGPAGFNDNMLEKSNKFLSQDPESRYHIFYHVILKILLII